MLLTLDSSLIVAALRRQETQHQQYLALLGAVVGGLHRAVEPLIVLLEVVAAIRRRTASGRLASRIERDLLTLPNVQFVELDRIRATGPAEAASLTGLRGMDAIVVATAQEFGSTLVTLDIEIQERGQGLVTERSAADVQRAGQSS